jgi:hypothetical protein
MSAAEHDECCQEVLIDGLCLEDLRWLCASIEEFASFGSTEAVSEFVRLAGPALSARLLKQIAASLSESLSRRAEASR